MASSNVPETRVLAIASHVTYGYVGNTMATFVMQSLGCEVAAINTVNFSNHTGYKQVKGRKATAEEILDLYEGLKQSYLTDFDVFLSGYIPNAAAISAVGKIGRDLKYNATTKPGSLFWVLDPVMGDDGRLYVSDDVVPEYKILLREADLILPNQYEAELLSDVKITDLASLAEAIQTLHRRYNIPHVIVTSLRISTNGDNTLPSTTPEQDTMTVIGSTSTSQATPRLFYITIPALPVYFSGTGDMFAALTVARFREQIIPAGLLTTLSWKSPDDVAAPDLPLARAAEKVLASMQAVLAKTMRTVEEVMREVDAADERAGAVTGSEGEDDRAFKRNLRQSKAAEVQVVRNVEDIKHPPDLERFRAKQLDVQFDKAAGESKPDELGVTHLGGELNVGAVHIENDKRWGPGP